MRFDVGIIGSGMAGMFAALRLAEYHKDAKTILFELGRPAGKRRRQVEGWGGCFPTGDGKLYTHDAERVMDLADGRSTKAINKWFQRILFEVNQNAVVKNKRPNESTLKSIKELGFDIALNDYAQWFPEDIHKLLRLVSERIEESGNVEFCFDNEVYEIFKRPNSFLVSTATGDYECKKLILCAGRTGWRWVNKLYRKLGILVSDNKAMFGVRVELPAQYMKEFNKSHCTLTRENLVVGPFSWGGSVIQEDHANLTIAAFRSNESRWKTDKVFFSVIGTQYFEDNGCSQTDRLSQLAFLLFGDRVGRERLKLFTKGSSQLNLIPEYNWLHKTIEELNEIMPALISRGYYHCPDIYTLTSEIRISPNLETEIDGLFVAGESAGISGIAAAGIMGGIAAENVCK